MSMSFLIDIHGTLINTDYTPVDGAVRWLNGLHVGGHNYLLATNSTRYAPNDLYEMLSASGFSIDPNRIMSCLSVAADNLSHRQVKTCFLLGTSKMKEFFATSGFTVVDSDAGADAVIVGDDPELSRERLSIAARALLSGAYFVALHKKRLCRDSLSRISIDVGAVVAALEYCVDRRADIIGKPSGEFYSLAASMLKTSFENILNISDDPVSDLIDAKRLGMKTAFVKTGTFVDNSVIADMPDECAPDYIYNTICEVKYQ